MLYKKKTEWGTTHSTDQGSNTMQLTIDTTKISDKAKAVAKRSGRAVATGASKTRENVAAHVVPSRRRHLRECRQAWDSYLDHLIVTDKGTPEQVEKVAAADERLSRANLRFQSGLIDEDRYDEIIGEWEAVVHEVAAEVKAASVRVAI